MCIAVVKREHLYQNLLGQWIITFTNAVLTVKRSVPVPMIFVEKLPNHDQYPHTLQDLSAFLLTEKLWRVVLALFAEHALQFLEDVVGHQVLCAAPDLHLEELC